MQHFSRIPCHLDTHSANLAGPYFSAGLRVRNVSAFCIQFCGRAAARTGSSALFLKIKRYKKIKNLLGYSLIQYLHEFAPLHTHIFGNYISKKRNDVGEILGFLAKLLKIHRKLQTYETYWHLWKIQLYTSYFYFYFCHFIKEQQPRARALQQCWVILLI